MLRSSGRQGRSDRKRAVGAIGILFTARDCTGVERKDEIRLIKGILRKITKIDVKNNTVIPW